jgi:multidrug resistance efflux pump
MIELLLCSFVTIFPDYLYRRYIQDKRLGRDINLFSVWFELRWGITACLMLTVTLITIIFYNHPSTTNAKSYFRTIPILPEESGRVAEIYVASNDSVKKGAPIFKLDITKQEAELEVVKRRIAEVDASLIAAQADVAAADGQIQQAKGAYEQALDELRTKEELARRNPDIVARREIERLQKLVETKKGAVTIAAASKQTAETRISQQLPAEKSSAEATLKQTQVQIDKATVYAGVTGQVVQFGLQVGDIVNPFMRPAGVLVPAGGGRERIQAGFGQIEAQVMKVGMAAEVTCISKPLTIIPMVVADVQDYIAAGQFRASDQLIDAQQQTQPGTILVILEPLYEGGLDGVTPGSSCIANAYSNNHDLLESGKLGFFPSIYLHIIDAVAIVHAMIIRVQALILPVKILVFTGH